LKYFESQVEMNVVIKGIGDLKDYLGKEPREVELPQNARVKDLLMSVEQHWGSGFPPYLWDFEKHQFRGPIVLVINKKAVQDLESLLQDGIEISIMRAIAGG
jgi:sulfur carrier protein ThiS